jgi:cell division septal protein FtsQ
VSRQRRRARHLPTVRRKGLRRVHGVCVALVLLGAAGFWMSLGSPPPVPIRGESWATVLGVSGGVL